MRIQNNQVYSRSYRNAMSKKPAADKFSLHDAAIATSETKIAQPAASPCYQLTGEQAAYFKSKYNIADISIDDFHKLMSELADMGVVAESDSNMVAKTENGLAMVSRPITVGLHKQETHDAYFKYSGFEGGDFLNWLEAFMAKNVSAIDWIKNSRDSLNTGLENLRNMSSLEGFNQTAGKIRDVLNQLAR